MRYAVMGATVDQVRSVGATDIKEARSTGIIFATLTKEQASRLRSKGCTVSKVGEVKAAVMPPIITPPVPVAAVPTYTPEQLTRIVGMEDLRSIFRPLLYGEGFTLAMIDTGIRETHEMISGRVVYSKNYTSDPMRDGFDHGTGTCSIAVAVAPLCNILNLKVLNDKGEGTEEEVVLAIDDCIDFQDSRPEIAPSVINLSLGSPDDGNPNNILRVACRAAIDKGIWIASAGGNSGPAPGTIMSPACERYVMAVGSLKYLASEKSFILSNFSSRGPTLEGFAKPDVVMFGEDIVTASSSSDTATIAKSGTSFATPFVSGFGILYREGTYRLAVAAQPISGISIPVTWGVAVQDIVDKYLPLLCIKPEGVSLGKDNDYGYGLAFGPLVLRALGFGAAQAVDISALLLPVVAIGMMGMLMSTMMKG